MTPSEYRAHTRALCRASAGRDPLKSEPAFYAQAAELDYLETRRDLTPIEAARRERLRIARANGAIGLPGERWNEDALRADVEQAERQWAAAAE